MSFDFLAFLLGALCASAAIFALALVIEAVHKYVGHNGPRGPLGVG